jgi:hypothetical protein
LFGGHDEVRWGSLRRRSDWKSVEMVG